MYGTSADFFGVEGPDFGGPGMIVCFTGGGGVSKNKYKQTFLFRVLKQL